MAEREYHFRWEWDLRSSPDALWPLVADTNRFNLDAGIPGVQRIGGATEQADARLRMSVGGMSLEWDEAPFEWEAPHRFAVVRRYHAGPMREMRVRVELAPRDGGGTRLVYQIWMVPRGLLGRLLPLRLRYGTGPAFEAVFRRYDGLAASRAAAAGGAGRAELAPGGEARLEQARRALAEAAGDAALAARLAGLVRTADELTLLRLRPYELAAAWGAPRRRVLELCLHAVRAGLLDFRWDMLCPLCRGAKGVADTLGGVRRRVHCDACGIDFDVDFDRSVELTFRPNPSVRRLAMQEYCIGGPRLTPHIVVQQIVPAGGNREVRPVLEPGAYRLRIRREPGGVGVRVADGGPETAAFRASPDGWPAGEQLLGSRPSLTLENATGAARVFVLERTAWSDLAVTAAEVTALQLFRDLFSREALRPGEEISVGSLCVLFTDLLDSTRLYREIGDAPAFGLVMNHFDVLKRRIAEEDGAVVKTIGDAVMAVFRQPLPAVRAALRAAEDLARPAEGRRPLRLKAGIHHGPCIAVTLNDRLDYFGSTVNIAARLVSLCSGGDVVLSSEVMADPEIAAWIGAARCAREPLVAALKGFGEAKFELTRLVVGG